MVDWIFGTDVLFSGSREELRLNSVLCLWLMIHQNGFFLALHSDSIMLGKSTFMPKPLPQEINLLIAESSEMDCQQQQQQQEQQQQLLNSLNYTPGTMDDDEEDNRRWVKIKVIALQNGALERNSSCLLAHLLAIETEICASRFASIN